MTDATSTEFRSLERVSRAICLMLLIALFIVASAAPSQAEAGTTCADRFPEAEWTQLSSTLDLYATGVPTGHAERFATEINSSVTQIESQFGQFQATVCLFDPNSDFDQSRFTSGSGRLHAMLLTEDGLLLISTESVGHVGSAAAFGVAHIAMWQYSDGSGFLEPQASTIAQYFRSEARDRAILDHAEAKSTNFFGPEVTTKWGAGTQRGQISWDPSRGRPRGFDTGGYDPVASASAASSTHMSDLVRFGLAQGSDEFITEPDNAAWADLEARWRSALTIELMGTEEPTTDWKGGVSIAAVSVLVAVIFVVLGYLSKRRKGNRPPTAEPIPGFFEMAEARND